MSIEIKNITKKYKNDFYALNDINTSIEEGKIYALLGKNGAGKSTLLNILANRLFPTSGAITINNKTIFDNEANQNNIFLASEELLVTNLKIKDIYKLTASFYEDYDWNLTYELTKLFKLNTNKKLNELSTGLKSLVKLVLAFSVPCKYIFLDEPVLGLDVENREAFYKILIDQYIEKEKTYVISTHLIEEIARAIEYAIIIDNGKIVKQIDISKLSSSVVTLSGPTNIINEYVKDYDIIGSNEFAGITSVQISNYTETNIPNGISISPFNIQDYFLNITKNGGIL
ncbi:ATP-binding cassette domain-containing protein [Mycoplasma sp. P36-A1]|uniref:ATP-binding cassette domain-containing protein n=1 Tax=Mycoplasma sp. P36-A1 TaxID=3252900 RepID=UPI003C2B5343